MVEQQQHHTAMSSLDTQALLTHHSHYRPSHYKDGTRSHGAGVIKETPPHPTP